MHVSASSPLVINTGEQRPGIFHLAASNTDDTHRHMPNLSTLKQVLCAAVSCP